MKPLYATGGAVLGTVALGLVARLLDVDMVVDPRNGRPPGEIAIPFAAAVTLVVSLLGWGLRVMLDRFTRNAARLWTIVATAVLALSFLPLPAVGASAGTKTILALMHIAVAAALIPVLGRRKAYAEAA